MGKRGTLKRFISDTRFRCYMITYDIRVWLYKVKILKPKKGFDRYKKMIKIIQKYGFNIIGVCDYACEYTFIFETNEEAIAAYNMLENIPKPKVSGWWYSKEELLHDLRAEKIKYDTEVKIYWIEDEIKNR